MLVLATPGGPPIEEAPLHRIGIRWAGECRDLFQILFHNGMIFVGFPYQPDAPGLVAKVTVQAGNSHTFDLTDTADATTKSVKYSHPVDGNAHFSQTGKVVTAIYNQARGLDTSVGHFFSVFFSGLSMFRRCRYKKPYIQFAFDSSTPVDPLYCSGYWLKLGTDIHASSLGNPIQLDPNDSSTRALAIAPPPDSPFSGWILAISARRGPTAMSVEPGNFALVSSEASQRI